MSKKIKFLFGEQSDLTNNNKEDGALYFAKYKTDDTVETSNNTFVNLYYADGTNRFSIEPIVNYETSNYENIVFWTSASDIRKGV